MMFVVISETIGIIIPIIMTAGNIRAVMDGLLIRTGTPSPS